MISKELYSNKKLLICLVSTGNSYSFKGKNFQKNGFIENLKYWKANVLETRNVFIRNILSTLEKVAALFLCYQVYNSDSFFVHCFALSKVFLSWCLPTTGAFQLFELFGSYISSCSLNPVLACF